MKTQITKISNASLKLGGFLIMALFLGSYAVTAQNTLNASGGSQSISSGTFDYAIGEMTLVSTQSNGSITVTQGLLQSGSSSLSTPEAVFSDQNLKIFPNPVKNSLYINPAMGMAGELSIELFDLHGRRILQKAFFLQSGLEKQELDLSSIQVATYMLSVQFKNGEKIFRQSYKIIKNNGR